jgi:hypothetical protein
MNCTVLSIMLVVLFGVPAPAQEKITLKLKRDAKGDVTQTTEKDAETGKMTFTVMGMAQPKDQDKASSWTFKEEIIDKETGKKATKLKQTYQQAEMNVEGKKITPSFIGKEILIDLSGDTQKFTVDGKELTGDDLAFMNEQFKDRKSKKDESNIDELMLPKNAVAVGETWKPDVAAIVKDMAGETRLTCDAAKSTAVGKLLKAYKKEGKQFGIFEVEMKFALTKVGAGPMAIDLDATSVMTMTIHFDGCIDGTLHTGTMDMKMAMKMAGSLKTPNGVEVKLDGDIKRTASKTDEDLNGKN